MGKSRSRTPSRKKSHRRSSSRSKHSKKSRHRTPERKSSKYRHRSESSSDSSRYKSSSKYQSKRRNHSRSPSRRKYRRSTSSSSSSSNSSSSNGSCTHRSSSSSDKLRNKASSNYMDKIRSMRTPTPPMRTPQNFDAGLEFLDKRHVTDSLAEINANEFKPKTFSSASNSKSEKSDADVLKVKGDVRPIKTDSNDDPLFHQKVFGDDDVRMEQWVHRLYTYRQKMFAPSN